MKLIYAPEAVADLVRLRAFIAEHDPSAAERIATELIARVEYLKQFPRMGREVDFAPEPETVRDIVYGQYIVRYTLHTETVMVLRVWHHYQERTPE